MVAVGLGFRWLFQNDGIVNLLLNKIGLNSIPWLGDPRGAMAILIILTTWKQIGFNLVVFLAGLQSISPNLYEAAKLDGAKGFAQFLYITLPGLRPTLVLTIITTTIFTLRSFEQVYVITGGGPLNSTNLLVYYIYEQAFVQFDFGYACTIASVLLIFTFILVYGQLKLSQTDP
jgi:multiple sugar transport system permease protein